MFCHLVGSRCDIGATSCLQVVGHVLVVSEYRTCCANFGTHVADGCFAGCGNAVCAITDVFNDCAGSTLHGKYASNFKNDVFRARPTRQCSGEFHANDFWPTNIEWETGHHVNGIGSTNSDGNHAQTTSIWCVAVGTNHHSARKCVVLKHYLVDDSAAWSPKANAVFCRNALQEVVHLFVRVDSNTHVNAGTSFCQNQVIAMHGARN